LPIRFVYFMPNYLHSYKKHAEIFLGFFSLFKCGLVNFEKSLSVKNFEKQTCVYGY